MAEVAEEPVTDVDDGENGAAESASEPPTEAVAEVDSEGATGAGEAEGLAENEPESAEEMEAEPEVTEEKEPELAPLAPILFHGVQKNPTVAIALLVAGVMSFSMGMTKTFFAEATAWTFIVWGLLLLFSNMLDNYQRYELNNDGIYIYNPIRFWYRNKRWSWSDIYRLDVLVGRRDTRLEHADMHIYHEIPGEMIKDREDRKLDPTMAQIVIERAGLQPAGEETPTQIADVPLSRRNIFHWTKSGSLA